MDNMNDIELTKKRQEEFIKYGKRQGFPVWVCFKVSFIGEVEELKVFFTPEAKDKYISQLEHGYNFIAYLTHVNDIKKVTYET